MKKVEEKERDAYSLFVLFAADSSNA